MKATVAWSTYGRHYDDLEAHERMRVRQRMALRSLQWQDAEPAIRAIMAAMEFMG